MNRVRGDSAPFWNMWGTPLGLSGIVIGVLLNHVPPHWWWPGILAYCLITGAFVLYHTRRLRGLQKAKGSDGQ